MNIKNIQTENDNKDTIFQILFKLLHFQYLVMLAVILTSHTLVQTMGVSKVFTLFFILIRMICYLDY